MSRTRGEGAVPAGLPYFEQYQETKGGGHYRAYIEGPPELVESILTRVGSLQPKSNVEVLEPDQLQSRLVVDGIRVRAHDIRRLVVVRMILQSAPGTDGSRHWLGALLGRFNWATTDPIGNYAVCLDYVGNQATAQLMEDSLGWEMSAANARALSGLPAGQARRGFPQGARHTVADVIRGQRACLGASRSAERDRQLADALHAPALRGVVVGAFPQGLLLHWVDEDARVRAGGAIVSKASRWRRTEARALMADLNRQRSRIPLVLMAVDGGFSAWALRTVVRRGTTLIGADLLMWRNPRTALAQERQQAAPDRRTT